ncbi:MULTISPECIES: aldo/keto reductase [Clavibacter]|uniref:Aldo/keto reductase n=2 Tax=Clavibacter TaxID=1573 RepID=A0A399NUL1_9MICO|nr:MULTISPECIES: aldo/keto reductase [Clavibacter]KDP92071.1 NADP-dependent aryl-alcohol dehydrogenase [Clavibacter cf. michiganensis LMG 26808]RII97684.1 aldo/keto reductase [Clavibacter michiganensis]UKF24924.1 aldo/keto reductase [Clavibacter sp. A6099]
MTNPARVPLGSSGLEVLPLSFGGNVFGWTADEATSFQLLDAYTAAGGNFIDTADVYSAWKPGNSGGESEEIIGRWLASRGRPDDLVIATKVGAHEAAKGTSRDSVRRGVEASLRRLGVDAIDLYYAHVDDQDTPIEETVTALAELVTEGKVRAIGASNFTAERLQAALDVSAREGIARFEVLQNRYNLVARDGYEGELADLLVREGIGSAPYSSLASGFLTGKYRGAEVDSPRSGAASKYLDDHGRALLEVLDRVAEAHGVSVTTVSLAWLRAQPSVTAPIASARDLTQLPDLLASVELELTVDEIRDLSAV